ncbi:UDP-N-acetylglucosamine 2-epimerase [Brevundimonas poindexterae]|uniref:UDP-N-acetylglucosamine 2-epimerase n=1 Tax=Brevundimonas poindexterae TaxID=74325 RepID=UPI001CFF3C29|nr:UDP-N-acetylglucosamine 2-epimerase [Brevundimonas poindexterae]
MRKIAYLSGTRADFGLMTEVLRAIDADPGLDLTVLVTGQHLADEHGYTAREIIDSGFAHLLLPSVPMTGEDGIEMAVGVARQMESIAESLRKLSPDLLLLLGDRGEMLAGAWAALFLGIPCVHFHGGERSGTVDDPMRQAITGLSQFHIPATPGARDRLIRMGERPQNIFLLGAPGLDALRTFTPDRSVIDRLKLDGAGPLLSVLFHPVVQDLDQAETQAEVLIDQIARVPGRAVVFAPNSDAGSASIRDCYAAARKRYAQPDAAHPMRFHWVTHLSRRDYLSLLACSDLLIGNSSSGIIEAASLATPTVNIGDRQAMRERNASVFDCEITPDAIRAAIDSALAFTGPFENLYDQGGCADQIAGCLTQLSLGARATKKQFSY